MYIVIGLVIGILIWVLTLPNPKDVQDLKRVEIIDATRLYKAGYENSGFSIGKSGMRSYYRRKNRYVGTDIKFRVTYNTGRVATVTAREGTERCKTLLDFMEAQDRIAVAPPAPRQVTSIPVVKSEAKTEISSAKSLEEKGNLVTTLSAIAEEKIVQGLSTSETKTAPPIAKPPSKKDVYPAGEYKVGVTIPAGEYAIYTKKKDGSYYEVNRKQNIVFNGFAKGVQLIELCDGDYFEFSDATVQPMEDLDLIGMNLPSCSLKVGVHIPPGEYLLTSLNGKSNSMSIYSSCRLTDKNMITFEYVKGNKFVTLKQGNVITYENCKIELVDDSTPKTSTSVQEIDELPEDEDDFFVQIQEEKLNNKCTNADKYPEGCYTVGENIPIGEYAILSEGVKETTIKVISQRHKKERVNFSFSGSCLLTLSSGDSFEIINGCAIAIDKLDEIPRTCKSYMLKVGQHIAAGQYSVKQANNAQFAIYYILKDSMMNLDEAIDSDAIFGTVDLTLVDGQYVYLENAVIESAN